jgi:hypothetical protein
MPALILVLACLPFAASAQKKKTSKDKLYRNEIGLNSNYILRSVFNFGPEPLASPIFQYKLAVTRGFRLRLSGGGGYNTELVETFDSPDRTLFNWGYIGRAGFEGRFAVTSKGALLLGVDGFYQNLTSRSSQTINPFSPFTDVVNSFDDETRYGIQPFIGAAWQFGKRLGLYFETSYSAYLYESVLGFKYQNKTAPDDLTYRNGTQIGYQPNATVYFFYLF